MNKEVNLTTKYKPSEDVVARKVQGEFVIIPISSGVGNLEEEIFSLNETGVVIWEKLDGKKSLNKIAQELSEEFKAPLNKIKEDCLGLASELLKRKMVVEAKGE